MDENRSAGEAAKRNRWGWKKLVRRLALLAGSLLLTLACLEVAVRLFTATTPGLTQKDPVIGQRYIQSFAGDVFVSEAGRKVPLRFNDVGFRGPTRPRQKPPGVRRIAVLGDSMIASLAVDEAQTMVCQLQRLLNESRTDTKWEVLNFGVNGASPGQELVLYREVVAGFEPDIVLGTFFVGNDLSDNCSRLSSNPRIYFDVDESGDLRQEPFSTRRAAASQFLNRHSRLYVWQRTALNRARHQVYQQAGALDPSHWIFSREEPPDVAHAWKITAKVFQALHRDVTAHGSRFAVVMIPSAQQIYRDAFAGVAARAGELAGQFDPDHPDRRLAEICREAGIPFFSMLDDFRRAAPSATMEVEEQWLFCEGVGHFNEQGDALAARAVFRFITQGDSQPVATRPLIGLLR
jgi:hypothetical protein